MTGLIRKISLEANKAGYDGVTPFMVDLAAKYLRDNYDKKTLIEGFIRQSHPPLNPKSPESSLDHSIWDKILSRDEEFFREKAFDIFKSLPVAAVAAFQRLSTYRHPSTGETIIKVDERNEIIDYFHSFVKIAIKYIHAIRQPCIVEENGKAKYVYRNPNFMKDVDVLAHAKKWNVKLEFSRE